MEDIKKIAQLSESQKELLIRRYESIYGKLYSGHYLDIWVSSKGNIMIRHMFDEGDNFPATVVRQLNMGYNITTLWT